MRAMRRVAVRLGPVAVAVRLALPQRARTYATGDPAVARAVRELAAGGAARKLGAPAPDEAADWARWMAEEVRERWRLPPTARLGAGAERELDTMVQRVLQDEPLSYVLGNQPFGPLNLAVRPPVLIPRPETETWATAAAQLVAARANAHLNSLRVLDLCTGSGCIALLVAYTLGKAQVPRPWSITAVDCDPDAIALACENAERQGHALRTASASHWQAPVGSSGELHVVQADVFDDAAMRAVAQFASEGPGFDVVLCNPPYIAAGEWAGLDASVRQWESRRALVGDSADAGANTDGLAFYRRLAALFAGRELVRPAHGSEVQLFAEFGAGQAGAVERLLAEATGRRTAVWDDEYGHKRVVLLYGAHRRGADYDEE